MNRSSAALWLLLALQLAAACVSAAPAPCTAQQQQPPAGCNFTAYIRHKRVTSWEFQLDAPEARCSGKPRSEVLQEIAAALVARASDHLLRLEVAPHSLRTSVSEQTNRALSTLDGRPLFPPKKCPLVFPWDGAAFIRYRKKHAMYRGVNESATLFIRPQRADLTLKVKSVELDDFPLLHEALEFPRKVERHHRAAHLKWKIENDQYCSVGRPSYEAKYAPVSTHRLATETLKGMRAYFPGLPKYLQVPRTAELPLLRHRFFSKSVWDVSIAGVEGVANWVINYPTLYDALVGAPTGQGCELSFRLKRRNIADQSGDENVAVSLDSMAAVAQALHDDGWDTGVH